MDMLHYRHQPTVVNAFPVDTCHVISGVAHQHIASRLIPATIGNRAVGVPETVKVQSSAAVDPEPPEQLAELPAERTVGGVPRPGATVDSEENQVGIAGLVRGWAVGHSLLDGLDSFSPERDAPIHPGLWSGIVQPSTLQVQDTLRQTATIGIPATTVDAQQDHC